MNKVIIIALACVIIGLCDKMMLRGPYLFCAKIIKRAPVTEWTDPRYSNNKCTNISKEEFKSSMSLSVFNDVFANYYYYIRGPLARLLVNASTENGCYKNVTKAKVVQYDLDDSNYPLVRIAFEVKLNFNSNCTLEAVGWYDADCKSLNLSKLYNDYPPFKKAADLPK